MLEVLDIGPEFLSEFSDQKAISPAEQEKLSLLLMRLQKVPLVAFETDMQPPLSISKIYGDASAEQGHVFQLLATARRVERVELAADVRERLGFDAYYRCQLESFGEPVVLYTLAVPKAWKLDAPLDHQCGGPAMFLKSLPNPDSQPADDNQNVDEHEPTEHAATQPPLVFVSPRLAWYPHNLLGNLRMDVGLFDEVSDRATLKERECFYQLLAAVDRAAEGYLEREARQQLAAQREVLEHG